MPYLSIYLLRSPILLASLSFLASSNELYELSSLPLVLSPINLLAATSELVVKRTEKASGML